MIVILLKFCLSFSIFFWGGSSDSLWFTLNWISAPQTTHFLARMLCMQHEVAQDESEKLKIIKSEIKHNRHHKEKQAAKKTKNSAAANLELRTINPSRFTGGMTPDDLHHVVIAPPNPGEALVSPNFGGDGGGGGGGGVGVGGGGGGGGPQSPSSPNEKSPFTDVNINLENDLREIRRAIRTLMTRLSEKDAVGRIAREWRIVALVLDRIFFWFYFIVIITAGLALLLPKGPTQTVEEVILREREEFVMTTPGPTPIYTE